MSRKATPIKRCQNWHSSKILPSWVATRKIYTYDLLIINNRRFNLHQGNVEAQTALSVFWMLSHIFDISLLNLIIVSKYQLETVFVEVLNIIISNISFITVTRLKLVILSLDKKYGSHQNNLPQ